MELEKRNFLFNRIAGFGLIFINSVEFNPSEPDVGARMNHHLNGWWLKLTKQIVKWFFYGENMNPNNPSPWVKLSLMDEPIPTDWMNYMRVLCPKAMMWILLLMQIDPTKWNSLWKDEIIKWNFMLFQNEIGFIHELLPSVLFHPWKCIQSFFCPWDFM